MQPNEQLKSINKIREELSVDYNTVKGIVEHEHYRPPKFQIVKVGSRLKYYCSEVREFMGILGAYEGGELEETQDTENETENNIPASAFEDSTKSAFNKNDRFYYQVMRQGKILADYTIEPTAQNLLNCFGEGDFIINKVDMCKNGMLEHSKKITVSDAGNTEPRENGKPLGMVAEILGLAKQISDIRHTGGGNGNGSLEMIKSMMQTQSTLLMKLLEMQINGNRPETDVFGQIGKMAEGFKVMKELGIFSEGSAGGWQGVLTKLIDKNEDAVTSVVEAITSKLAGPAAGAHALPVASGQMPDMEQMLGNPKPTRPAVKIQIDPQDIPPGGGGLHIDAYEEEGNE